jgi:hypothetical protein
MLAAAACAGDPIAPILAACHSAVQPLVLSVAADTAIDPRVSVGCVVFPANTSTTDSAEYLLVPQAAVETPNFRSSFKLAGGVPVLLAPPVAALFQAAPASPAQQFHDALRAMEQNRAWPSLAGPAARVGRAIPRVPRSPPVGDQQTFQVLANLSVLQLTPVTATAQSVGTHVAIYVDNNAPPSGLARADYDKMRSDFDTLLYAADTAAFGRESDIDGNGLVIVLMTNVVNKLVTPAQCTATGYVGGFFLGADIDPLFASQFNHGEFFYTLVADTAGALSCPHSIAQIQRVVPVTFIHEFQHMISYNQHVLVRGGVGGEVRWLNEGMSHYAEELGGRAILAGTGGLDSVHYCYYVRGDLANLALYWADPGSHALLDTSGIGGLAERGADWLFVRYLVDRFAADTTVAAADAFTQQIDQTNLTGAQNVTGVTGQSFAKTLKQWSLANWVSDLPGFAAPAALKYKHWAFRTAYPRMNAMNATCSANLPASFPLVAVASAGPSVNLTGTMRAGSGGAYLRVLQAPGAAGFPLLFSDASGAQLSPSVVPRLNVIRIR